MLSPLLLKLNVRGRVVVLTLVLISRVVQIVVVRIIRHFMGFVIEGRLAKVAALISISISNYYRLVPRLYSNQRAFILFNFLLFQQALP